MSPLDTDHQRVADYYDRHYHAGATVGQPGHDLHRLARRLQIEPGLRVLDIACGTGEWLAVLASMGAVVSGIDISTRAVEVCRQRLPEGIFETGPAETLPFPTQGFDIVTCMGSLEHFLDQPCALREMIRVARPGGRVLILVPNAGFLPYRLGLYHGTQQQAIRETIRSLPELGVDAQGSRSRGGIPLARPACSRPPVDRPVPVVDGARSRFTGTPVAYLANRLAVPGAFRLSRPHRLRTFVMSVHR